jgi:hypothetical protein
MIKLGKFAVINMILALASLSTSSALAQALTWSSPTMQTGIQAFGQIDRAGVAAATYKGKIYIAYTDGGSAGNIWLTSQISGSVYTTPVKVAFGNGDEAVIHYSNPSLAVYNDRLWIGWVDNYGEADFTSTTDGNTFELGPWAPIASCSFPSTDEYQSPYDSPSLVAFGSKLYFGFRITHTNYLGICTISADTALNTLTASGQIYPEFTLGETPSLGVFDNNLYVAYKDTTGSNYIYLAQSTDGINFSLNTGAIGNHTSSAPSLATYNGALYIGYRQNSDGNKFYYTYSTDGVYFVPWISPSWTMGGPPALVVGPDNKLHNFFSENHSTHYLSTAVTE